MLFRSDLKMAKHRLVSDKDSPYYSLLLDTIKERQALTSTERKITISNKYKRYTNFAKNKDIFLAHRFAEDELIEELKKDIKKAGYNWKEGKREDLGSISEDILSKIESCGFFVAVMTRKDQLKSGRYTTSSWLIEEKGAALAFGHRPLIMVETDVDRHYVGFPQSDDEMIYFDLKNFKSKVDEAIKKIDNIFRKYNE